MSGAYLPLYSVTEFPRVFFKHSRRKVKGLVVIFLALRCFSILLTEECPGHTENYSVVHAFYYRKHFLNVMPIKVKK